MKELPKDWEWKKLGEVCEVNDRDHRTPKYLDSGIPLISPKDFTDFGVDFSNPKYVSLEEYDNFIRKCNPEFGDVLYSRIGTIGESRMIETHDKFVALHSIAILKPNRKIVLPKYILYIVRSNFVRHQAKKGTKSIGTPDLGLKEIKNFIIPLPPLPTQHKIIPIIERAENLKTLRQEANEETNKIIRALFYEMFGNVDKNPHNFEKVNIGKVAQLQGGYAFKSVDYKREGIRLVTISNVHYSRLNWDENTYLPEEYLMEYRDFALNEGDLVIAMTRPIIKSLDTVKLVEIQKSDLPALLNQRVGRFRILSSNINKKYLEYFCYGFEFKKEIEKFSSISLQPNVSSKQIESIKILLPPIAIQNQFASLVEKIESIKSKQSQSTQEINTLFDALMQKAFSGELVI